MEMTVLWPFRNIVNLVRIQVKICAMAGNPLKIGIYAGTTFPCQIHLEIEFNSIIQHQV